MIFRFPSVVVSALLLSVGALSSACSASGPGGAVGTGSGGTSGAGEGQLTGGGPGAGGGALDGSGGGLGSEGDGTGGGQGTAPAGILFEDDFEATATGPVITGGAPWTTTLPTEYDSGGVVEVTSSIPAHSGSNSVYVKKGNNGQGFLQLEGAPVFPFAGDKIHVRAYIQVPAWPENHVSWMEIGSKVNEEDELRVGAHQGVMQVNHWPDDEDQIAEGVTFPANTWQCIEYSYEISTNTLEVWLEGTKIDALTVVGGKFARPPGGDPVAAIPVEAVRFGTEIAATEAWFDDIAIGTGPIGCN